MVELKKGEAYCICCSGITEEFDSICLACKIDNNYPDTIYGV